VVFDGNVRWQWGRHEDGLYRDRANGSLDKEGIAQVSRRWCNSARLLQIIDGPADISKRWKPHCGACHASPARRSQASDCLRGAKHAHNGHDSHANSCAKDTVSLIRSAYRRR
jgi:hypothetical protein